jgi:hypothetical protein
MTIVVLFPLGLWQVHAKSTPSHRWLVVADAAAYVPTHQLDLSAVQPDFVPISFYKIFGEFSNDVNRNLVCCNANLCYAKVCAAHVVQ